MLKTMLLIGPLIRIDWFEDSTTKRAYHKLEKIILKLKMVKQFHAQGKLVVEVRCVLDVA
jgi:hypothetical protein